MSYQPLKTNKTPITKESAIGKSKLADKIGYWLYLFIRLFKKSTPEPNPSFLYLVSSLNLPILKNYWNKQGVECVDLLCKPYKLIVGFNQGYVLLRLHNGKLAVDKEVRGNNITTKYTQEVKGVINSMQIALRDKINNQKVVDNSKNK